MFVKKKYSERVTFCFCHRFVTTCSRFVHEIWLVYQYGKDDRVSAKEI